MSVGENAVAINEPEELRALSKNDIELNDERYILLLDLLAHIYTIKNEHRKSIDVRCELLDILMEEHIVRNGGLLRIDNIDFPENALDKIISLYLSIGGSLIFLKDFTGAKRYLEQGYLISFTRYGDKNEKTLKLNYNFAIIELHTNPLEGVRQLHYIYKDMLQYLWSNNKYTKKAMTCWIHLVKCLGNLKSQK